MPIAAANEGGGLAGAGVGLGAGFTMAQQMMNAMRPDQPGGPSPQNPTPPRHRRQRRPRRRAADGRSGRRSKILFRMRQVDPEAGQILSRMRNATVVSSVGTARADASG